jgi:hypothetical protein
MVQMFYLFHLFRSFLPLHNPIGFGAPDFIELALAIIVVALGLSSRIVIDNRRKFAARTGWCMLALFVLPIALRVAMVRVHPIPTPLGVDDFSYVLLGDTLTHFRFSSPTHPLHQFFETLFVLQEPRYASIYPMGQGIAIAIGQLLFGNPWAGVALSIGAFAAACYWMLRGWITPGWALLGGLFAALQFGALSQWMNSFWGGAVPAAAGCLVYGALPRLQSTGHRRYAILLGAGIGISAMSRPYETVFLVVSAILFFAPVFRKPTDRPGLRTIALISLSALPALGLILIQNRSVSGSWTTLPYMLSRYEYGVPCTFTWQADPVPHHELIPQQKLAFETQKAKHDDSVAMGYFRRFVTRLPDYRFFFIAPLYLALLFFITRLREFRYLWMVGTILLFSLGINLYPYFFSHYLAAVACLFVLITVVSLNRMGPEVSLVLVFLTAAHFIFWYGLHFAGNQDFARDMWQYDAGVINTGDPQGRREIHDRIAFVPGKHLVFVRYRVGHAFQEWVYNAADIDSSRIVWARDLGDDENEKLRHYYPDRAVWLLRPDVTPPLLTPYVQAPVQPTTETVVTQPDQPGPKKAKPKLHFEEVP